MDSDWSDAKGVWLCWHSLSPCQEGAALPSLLNSLWF